MNERATWSHATELPADLDSPMRVRAFVSGHLVEHHTPVPRVDVILLVASELATNAALHARTPFTVGLTGSEHSLRLDVRDGSDAVPVLAAAGGSLETGGRGLWILEEFSLDWGVTRHPAGGKSVWATFEAQ